MTSLILGLHEGSSNGQGHKKLVFCCDITWDEPQVLQVRAPYYVFAMHFHGSSTALTTRPIDL